MEQPDPGSKQPPLPVWHTPIAVCTVLDCWWWTENLTETVEFYSKNKFEKLVHVVGFIIRIYHDARSAECQIQNGGNFLSTFRDNLSEAFERIKSWPLKVGRAQFQQFVCLFALFSQMLEISWNCGNFGGKIRCTQNTAQLQTFLCWYITVSKGPNPPESSPVPAHPHSPLRWAWTMAA